MWAREGFALVKSAPAVLHALMNLPNAGESPKRADTGSGVSTIPKNLDDLHKSITMAQIAKAAGVSQGAISSLLNDRDYGIRVSDRTRERVFKVCREMGYIPNDLRAVVRMYPELGDYCLLVASDIAGGLLAPVVTRIAAAVMAAVPESSHSVNLGIYDPAADYHADPARLPSSVRSGVCSKFLVYGEPNASLLGVLTRRGLPVMSLGYDVALPGVVSFVPDYALASHMAIEHLSKLGHTDIGIVSGPFGATDHQLLELNHGVRVACEALRLPLDGHHILYGDLTAEAGRSAFDEMFAREPQPTAIFCMSDSAAIGVIAQAQARGIAVPGTLSVIGCGDDPAGPMIHPQLTTIHLPAEEMGEHAAQEINRLVHDSPAPVPRKTVPPLRLIERQSCAARKP